MGLLILIRGISGSGKSTFAKEFMEKNSKSYLHLEADMFFNKGGDYKFDPSQLKDAHSWCQEETKKELDKGGRVLVSNTFTRKWEMQAYLDMAVELNVDVIVYRAIGNFDNVHGVPSFAVELMKERFEDYEGEVILDPMALKELLG